MFQADGRVWVWHKVHEAMDLSCQQGTMHVGGGSRMVLGTFKWNRLGQLVSLNTLLTINCYIKLLHDYPQTSYTRTMIGYSSRLMYHVMGPSCPELVQGVFCRLLMDGNFLTLFHWARGILHYIRLLFYDFLNISVEE